MGGHAVSVEEARAIARRLVEEVWTGNLDLMEDLFAPTCVIRFVFSPERVLSVDAYRQVLEPYTAAFTDIRTRVEGQLAAGDLVVTRWSAVARHVGPFAGISPTGREASLVGMFTMRIADRRVVEMWATQDNLAFMQQLGAVAGPAPVAQP